MSRYLIADKYNHNLVWTGKYVNFSTIEQSTHLCYSVHDYIAAASTIIEWGKMYIRAWLGLFDLGESTMGELRDHSVLLDGHSGDLVLTAKETYYAVGLWWSLSRFSNNQNGLLSFVAAYIADRSMNVLVSIPRQNSDSFDTFGLDGASNCLVGINCSFIMVLTSCDAIVTQLKLAYDHAVIYDVNSNWDAKL